MTPVGWSQRHEDPPARPRARHHPPCALAAQLALTHLARRWLSAADHWENQVDERIAAAAAAATPAPSPSSALPEQPSSPSCQVEVVHCQHSGQGSQDAGIATREGVGGAGRVDLHRWRDGVGRRCLRLGVLLRDCSVAKPRAALEGVGCLVVDCVLVVHAAGVLVLAVEHVAGAREDLLRD